MSDERKRDSERARQLEAETREIQKSTTHRARQRLHSIDATVDKNIEDLCREFVQEAEDDSAARDIRALAERAGISIPTSMREPPDAVLVVCFENGLQNMMAYALSSDRCVVYRAGDGLEALNKLATMSKCDCIVLDLALPSFVSGRQLVQFLEETPFAATPLVVVETPPRRIVPRSRGRVEYVPKPVDKGRLIATVRSLIESRRTSKAP